MIVDNNTEYSVLKLVGSLTSDGIFVYNMHTDELEYVNHSMVRIFDISHDSFRTQREFFINHVIKEDVDYLLAEFDRLKAGSAVENVEFHLRLHDGTIRIFCCNAFLVDGRIIGFVRDITRQRENEQYVVNYGAKKDSLLDTIAQKLAEPLRCSNEMLEKMSDPPGSLDSDVKDQVQCIRNTTTHCIEVVNEFLRDEHFTSENISIKRTRFDALEKIDYIVDGLRLSNPEKQVVVASDVARLYVNTDETKFMQIIQNLISNAVKFTKINGRIQIQASQMAKSFSITVTDDGIGIPDDLKPVIYEKYTPASRRGLRGERSNGMGLYIVNRLVSMLGGKISFESKEGEGSRFTIQFLLDRR